MRGISVENMSPVEDNAQNSTASCVGVSEETEKFDVLKAMYWYLVIGIFGGDSILALAGMLL